MTPRPVPSSDLQGRSLTGSLMVQCKECFGTNCLTDIVGTLSLPTCLWTKLDIG
jgi:hypothetical protein